MALAILEFRDDTADSIMLPPYVVGRCGDRGSGHSSNINKNYLETISCWRTVDAVIQNEQYVGVPWTKFSRNASMLKHHVRNSL